MRHKEFLRTPPSRVAIPHPASPAGVPNPVSSDFEPGEDYFTARREPFGDLRLLLRIGPLRFALTGLAPGQHETLARRFRPFVDRCAGTPAADLTVRFVQAGVNGFLAPPREETEIYRMGRRAAGTRIAIWSYEFAGSADAQTGRAELALVVAGGPAFERGAENFLRVLTALQVLDHGGLLVHGAGIVRRGRAHVFFGPSGSGKTTVLRLVLGFAVPEAGTIRLGGETVSAAGRLLVPPEERGLAVVFQDLALWPHLTVRGNLAFGLAARSARSRERESRIAAMLERLGIADKADRYPGGLSGGERQRVAIARALVLEPRALLLDEPLSNLDVTLKRELLVLFRELFRESGSTTLYVTHDLREAASLGDRIAVMESGQIAQVGNLYDLRAAPASAFVRSLIEDLH